MNIKTVDIENYFGTGKNCLHKSFKGNKKIELVTRK